MKQNLMKITERLKLFINRKTIHGAVVFLGIVVLIVILKGDPIAKNDLVVQQKPIVTLTTPIKYSGGQSISLIGNVRAFSEAEVTSERAGSLTAVNVNLGQQIPAGTILATLENASERASVLQAEGIYDAAVAAAAQSGVGLDEAKNSLKRTQDTAVSAFKSAYNTTNGVVVNSIDSFFANPNSRIPGLRISGRGFTSELNDERVAYQTLLPTWQNQVNVISSNSNLETELGYAKQNVERTINFIDTFLEIFNQHDNSKRYTDTELQGFSNSFTNLRSTLIETQSSLDTSLTGLSSSADGVRRAELAAVGGVISVADAQVKQALGALGAAQANLAKTILRTPISGTVNALPIRTGDFINSFAEVAIVANNNALEVITYISDSEKNLLAKGDSVLVEGTIVGTVTEIAPAVDSVTRKTEVRIATEDANLTNGDTVRITKQFDAEITSTDTIQVPLTAVKFDRSNGSVFIVEDGKLVSKSVSLGNILGGSVEVMKGIAKDDAFVIDARGLVEGDEVEVSE
ncbi:MAG: multidrug efflux pump subunit AcrA (membrane-fusion protein) [Candidatus Paceibacteria bacterium]